jgi:hypothetical protein
MDRAHVADALLHRGYKLRFFFPQVSIRWEMLPELPVKAPCLSINSVHGSMRRPQRIDNFQEGITMSKLLQKLLIASSIVALAGVAQAQGTSGSSDTSSSTSSAVGVSGTGTAPTTSPSSAAPGAAATPLATSDNPANSAANDPYVKRRVEKKAAKEEYKAQKKAAKAEYKAQKKEANAELKASGATAASNNSDLYPNNTANTSGK